MIYMMDDFCLQDDRSENWRLQAVSISPARFESRKPLPYLWRGLENDRLSEVAGIPGSTFVHMSGFIGGNRSYDGALAMARASLKAQAMVCLKKPFPEHVVFLLLNWTSYGVKSKGTRNT